MTFPTLRFVVTTGLALSLQLGLAEPSLSERRGEQGSANGMPFRTLQQQVSLMESDLYDAVALLEKRVETLEASDLDQDELIAELQSGLMQLSARVLANETDIEALQVWRQMQEVLVAELENYLMALEERVAANEADVAAIILADRTMQELVGALQQEILLLEQLIALNAQDIGALRARIGDLEVATASLRDELARKQDRVLGVCPAGSSIREIHADGSVVCQPSGGGIVETTQIFGGIVTIPSALVFRRTQTAMATCPSTYSLSGGGFQVLGGDLGLGHVWDSSPIFTNSWRVWATSDSVGERGIQAIGRCMRVR